jgi:uncharacterized protein YndB with AHSA1/START domain
VIESCYVAFRRRVRSIAQQTTCTCNACRRIPELDLKLFAHHGEYVARETVGRANLVGAAVILAHRLLKNGVVGATGLRAYALMTESFLERCRLDLATLQLPVHVERYEDVGDVVCRVLDLDERWRRADREPLAYVSAEDAPFTIARELAAPLATVWHAVTDPAERLRWTPRVKRIDEDRGGGIQGVGTRNHCVHGRTASREEILDWKPFDYYTFSTTDPTGTFVFTVEFSEPRSGRTVVSWRAKGGDRRGRVAFRLLGRAFRKQIGEAMDALAALVETPARDASPGVTER